MFWLRAWTTTFLVFVGIIIGIIIDADVVRGWNINAGELIGGLIGAFGAWAGVVVTISSQEKAADRRRVMKAAVLALPLAQDAGRLFASGAYVRTHARQFLATTMIKHPEIGAEAAGPVPMWLEFPDPEHLNRFEDRLYLLGEETGGCALALLAITRALKGDLNILTQRKAMNQVPFAAIDIEQVESLAERMANTAARLGDLLTALYPNTFAG